MKFTRDCSGNLYFQFHDCMIPSKGLCTEFDCGCGKSWAVMKNESGIPIYWMQIC